MVRQKNFFEKIVDYQNIRFAFLKAMRGKRASPEVIFFCRNIEENLRSIKTRLLSENYEWGTYRSFSITDPKPRTISAVPFADRIIHHAIMNILEPVFEKQFVYHTYACRKGKGTHSAVLFAFSKSKAHPFFCKLDVRKYFDSIDHAVLKQQLLHIIKDKKVIVLLFSIIDSYHTENGIGLPIGNLTSQFFANLYLSSMDHFILEHLHPAAYVRYMDDFVFWENDKAKLQKMLASIKEYIRISLHLTLKDPVVGKSVQGLPFLGFLIKNMGIYLLQKSKRRVLSRIRTINSELGEGVIKEEKAVERLQSVSAAIALARSRSFFNKCITGAASGSNRVLRGGSWNNNAQNLRSANRNNNTPSNRNNNIGFRVVRP
ncbi:hypothetical protein FACS189494_09230 [Spirochaetia bacterium]|nr:hypothetical protein FACS189494_09230 [Spirochaetia bacterium]